jgi:hypothetical protein
MRCRHCGLPMSITQDGPKHFDGNGRSGVAADQDHEAAPRVGFTATRVADVSTAHVTARDGALMGDVASPYRCYHHDRGHGAVFYTPLGDDDAAREEGAQRLRQFGYSEAFVRLWRAATDAGLAYIMFDSDGAPVIGLPTFNW